MRWSISRKRKHAARIKRLWKTGIYNHVNAAATAPSARRKWDRSMAKIRRNPEYWRKVSLGRKEQWKNRKYRKLMSEASSKALKRTWRVSRDKMDKANASPERKAIRSRTFSRTLKKLWKTRKHQKRMARVLKKTVGRKTSGMQMSIFKSLCRRGYKGVRLNRREGTKFIDIAFPEKNLALEIDGPFWHRDKHRQHLRDRYLRRRGWSVKHFVANRGCKEKVLEFLEAA